MIQEKKKPIKVAYGGVSLLAKKFGVNRVTVYKALNYDSDTITQRKIRKAALRYVKMF